MAIKFHCEGCGRRIGVKDELAGKKVKCPGCGNALRVPARSIQAPSGEEKAAPSRPTSSAAPSSAVQPPGPATCKECNEEVPQNASFCPSCGASTKLGPAPFPRHSKRETDYSVREVPDGQDVPVLAVTPTQPPALSAGDSDAEIRIECPKCHSRGRAPSRLAEKRVLCKNCGAGIRVPILDPFSPGAFRYVCSHCTAPGVAPLEKAGGLWQCLLCGRDLDLGREQGKPANAHPTFMDRLFAGIGAVATRLKNWYLLQLQRHEEARLARAAEQATFRANNFQCPSCQRWLPNGWTACTGCGMPFGDNLALQQWQTNRLLQAQINQANQQRVSTSSNLQTVGCALMILGVPLGFCIFGFGWLLIPLGFVLMVIGACL